ncbi:hypothetical protein [Sphingomonas sp. M1-B02]|uniref:hypothetical protein n=1 Tax=Sphingomonas sp. M1-B02 TaxID=3114300 RepID=UPI00223FF03D|nr:hypothetical protein [Sphingomonas sp. S6-11]UZK65865.1 hypothetical protein OKW87_15345 [Sphingomonas sp. S6-11]
MTYAPWGPRYRLTTVAPGKLDLFVITFVDGKRATIDPITQYEDALAKVRAFHREHQCQIKVLPMTGPEVRNLLAIDLPEHSKPVDATFRDQMVGTLRQSVRESSDADARADALELLTEMGEVGS